MAFARLKAFFQDPKRSPKRSYNSMLTDTNNAPSFWQRLNGVYRMYTGRINAPKTVSKMMVDGAEVSVESPSRNHAGVYDYLTGGVLNAIESFASGNWIETPARRNVWKFFWAPVWAPLNAIRAIFGVVATLLSAIPTIVVHQSAKNAAAAAAAEAKRLADEAALNQPKEVVAKEVVARKSSSKEATQTAVIVASALSRRPVTATKTFAKKNGEPNIAELSAPVEQEAGHWKVTKPVLGNIKSKLVSAAAKHPERYTEFDVALPAGITEDAVNAYVNDRIAKTVGPIKGTLSAPVITNVNGTLFAVVKPEGTKASGPKLKTVSAVIPTFRN